MKKYLSVLTALLLAGVSVLGGCAAKSADTAFTEEMVYETTAAYEAANGTDSYAKSSGNLSNFDYAAGYEDAEYEYEEEAFEAPETETLSSSEAGANENYSEKLVYTCYITMQTTEFENTLAALKELIEKYEGFIEAEETTDSAYNWYYEDYEKTQGTLREYITVRIPSESYQAFLSDIEGEGKITSRSQTVDNITRSYYSTVTTIKSLETQEERLLQMMKDAATVEEMLQIEDRLTEVQNELAQYQTRLSVMDTDVDFSTVDLTVEEVLEYSPEVTPVYTSTFGDRLKNTLQNTWDGFVDFCEEALFFLIESFPFFLIFGLINFGIFMIIVKSVRKKRAKHTADVKAAAEPEALPENTETED